MRSTAAILATLLAVATPFLTAATLRGFNGQAACQPTLSCETFPVPPFSVPLNPGNTGDEVKILQFMLQRGQYPACSSVNITGTFDSITRECLTQFQAGTGLPSTGTLTSRTACQVVMQLQPDGYKDDGKPASAYGRLYKVVIPVHRNRSIESVAQLQQADGTVAHEFTVRLHGFDFLAQNANTWPSFNSSGCGMSPFASNGDTPTGLYDFDLNSPEPIPKEYGSWPVNRAVRGREGNAAFILPQFRYGILMHTGEWAQYSSWTPPKPMPNSEGCIHAYPEDIQKVASLLESWGVVANKNPFGEQPYPFQPQGILSVYEL